MGCCSFFESCLVFARACARATQNTISLFGGVQKEKWYFGIPKRKKRLNRTLAWARSVLTSANARGSSAYYVTQTTRCDDVEVWTMDVQSAVSYPRPASSPPGGAGGRRVAPPARGVPRGQRNDPWSFFLSGSTRFLFDDIKKKWGGRAASLLA